MNRLRMRHRASFSAAEREIERIEVRRKKLIEMMMNGGAPLEVRASAREARHANGARRRSAERESV